jgi:hypothetical protein
MKSLYNRNQRWLMTHETEPMEGKILWVDFHAKKISRDIGKMIKPICDLLEKSLEKLFG